MSELQDVVQLGCIRCQNTINSLMIGEQPLELICEHCLENQSQQHIRLKLEVELLEKAVKQIKSRPSQDQQSLLVSKQLQNQKLEKQKKDKQRVRVQCMEMEKRIKQQQLKNLQLYEQLMKVEQKEEEAEINFYRQSQQLNLIYAKLTHQKAMLAEFTAYQQMLKGFKLNLGLRQFSR